MQLQPPVKRQPYCPPVREPIPENDEPVVAETIVVAEVTVSVVEAGPADASTSPVVETAIDVSMTPPSPPPETAPAPAVEVFGEGIIPPTEPP